MESQNDRYLYFPVKVKNYQMGNPEFDIFGEPNKNKKHKQS